MSLEKLGNQVANIFLGGWDRTLETLIVIMLLDYMTGVSSAFKNKVVSSSVGYKGLVKKATVFIVIILAAQIDKMINAENHVFRNCTALSFSINESLSILENVGKSGIKLPAFVRSSLLRLKQQTEDKMENAAEIPGTTLKPSNEKADDSASAHNDSNISQ